ncbi:putative dithiobiotin synthetase [Salmonella bongori]|nr:putative dithiobiotin synthetase [Salmonella bongori]
MLRGTGGWRSLMNDLRPLSEWVVQEQLPVFMVVGIQEGCINHALLTAQAIASDGLPFIGWVANRINPVWRTMLKSLTCWGKNCLRR